MRPLVSRKSKMDASIVLGCGGEQQVCVHEHKSNIFAGRCSQGKKHCNIVNDKTKKWKNDQQREKTLGVYLDLQQEAAECVSKRVVKVICDPAT